MLVQGNTFNDERGTLNYFNDFHLDGIKRFYVISHPDISIIRAWQGHKIETKHFHVIKGKFLISWVKIDDWENPSKELKVNRIVLDAFNPQILTIPPGNANGLKALEPNSQVVIFASLDLMNAKNDDYRFKRDFWSIQITD